MGFNPLLWTHVLPDPLLWYYWQLQLKQLLGICCTLSTALRNETLREEHSEVASKEQSIGI